MSSNDSWNAANYLGPHTTPAALAELAGQPQANRKMLAAMCRNYAAALDHYLDPTNPAKPSNGIIVRPYEGNDVPGLHRTAFITSADVLAEITRLRACATQIDALG